MLTTETVLMKFLGIGALCISQLVTKYSTVRLVKGKENIFIDHIVPSFTFMFGLYLIISTPFIVLPKQKPISKTCHDSTSDRSIRLKFYSDALGISTEDYERYINKTEELINLREQKGDL